MAGTQTVRFGPFQLDKLTGELIKDGIRLKLHGQPIQLLEVLLKKPNSLVTRDELRQQLWNTATFVDFDHSLDTAIKKLRQALGDEAEEPSYIETLPKRGYRFIGQVEEPNTDSAPETSVPAISDSTTPGETEQQSPNKSSLAIGQMIGRYRIEEQIGAGGMGVVYRAHDEKLDRDLAIKILSPGALDDAVARKRFRNEARVLSRLNHPAIQTIHDFDQIDGYDLLISEFVPGVSLDTRVSAGPLPEREVVRLGLQLAQGLAAAHAEGVLHRDLKPSNLRVTPDGRLRILDFGLATLSREVAVVVSKTTESIDLLPSGVAGTLPYMSPEQLLGESTDERSDVYSAGVVLFEIATGQIPFREILIPKLTNAIVSIAAPRPTSIIPSLSPELERIILKCLEKEAELRYQSAKELAADLRRMEASSARVTTLTGPRYQLPSISSKWARPLWIGVLLVLLLLIALVISRSPRRPSSVTRSIVRAQLSFAGKDYHGFAISPDGRYLAFTWWTPDTSKPGGWSATTWLRNLQNGREEPLPGVGAGNPLFWSPDGDYIGFFTPGKLKKIALDTKNVTNICDQQSVFAAAWGKSGIILMATPRGMESVSKDGGRKNTVFKRERGSLDIYPSFLPDGKHFLFLRTPNYFARNEFGVLYVGTIDGSPPRSLGLTITGAPAYSAGSLLYPTEQGLFGQPFDAVANQPLGKPVLILDTQGANVTYSASQNGVLLSRLFARDTQITLHSRDGSIESVPLVGLIDDPRFSPDGTRIAYDLISGENMDIWVHDLRRKVNIRLTPGDSVYDTPIWSPDGKRIVFNFRHQDRKGIAVINSDGSGSPQVIFETPSEDSLSYWIRSWSPVNDCLFISVAEIMGPQQIGVLCLKTDRKLKMLQTPEAWPKMAGRWALAVSPDGKLLAYTSNETGVVQISVIHYPGPSEPVRVSVGGGNLARWRADGRELFFVLIDKVKAVPVNYEGGHLSFGIPRDLFTFTRFDQAYNFRLPFDAAPDGQHFAINQPVGSPSDSFDVITNWDLLVKQ